MNGLGRSNGRSQRLIVRGVLVFLTLLLIETGSLLTSSFMVSRGWMAAVPRFTSRQTDEFFMHRTALGWGAPLDETGRVLEPRARRDRTRDGLDGRVCVSAYGDSFTAGSGVKDDETYPHELASIFGCHVSNYGLGGYGSDQAFMLWRAQRHLDMAPVVVLGHLSENILRNVNQYRNLLYPGQELFFKPRFVQQDGALVAVPIPIRTAQDFQQLESDPASVLLHDAFLDRPRRAFPYTLAVARWLVDDFHVRSKLAGVPRHEAFYHADHPARALQLTSRILAAFATEAHASGRTPFVVLIPMGDDLVYALKTNRWPDQPLADALREAGVPVIHAGPPMLARLQAEEPCHLFSDCNGHFNARGYRMLAEVVADRVRDAVNAGRDARPAGPGHR